jgi:radical SAM superfamily enzyme YgiQ (UPF0313 family)
MKVLLVSPAVPTTFWSFTHVLPLLGKRAAFPPLGLLTVAAMLPRDWELRVVDLNVRGLDDADVAWADYVLLSAMIVQERSVGKVVARCQALGKPIIAGGPLFTTGHERFPAIPHFVLGEAEPVIAALVADMRAGRVQPLYGPGAKPDLEATPPPRWDLVRLRDYATMPLQFSRGCPFDCEFCDIVAMYGRTPRTKTPEQFTRELDALWDAGWRESVFIVDDNFIGHRPRAKALLSALAVWQARHPRPLPLLTEASLNLADDPDLIDLFVAAGFKKVFIGLETPNEQSLVECGKNQNARRDLVASVHTLQRAGLEVMGGFIVGFDSDEHSIFERQLRFIQESGVVTAMVGLLGALPRTRLFERLKAEGRLLRESTGNNLDAVLNFVPRMDAAKLVAGYRQLVQQLYAPRGYYRRALTFLASYEPRGPRAPASRTEQWAFLRSLWVLGVRSSGRRAYWRFMLQVLLSHRSAFGEAMNLAITGHHFRRVAAQL